MAETVQLELQVTGAGQVEQQIRRVQSAIGDLGSAVQRIGGLAELGFLAVALQQVAQVVGRLSGLSVAAEYEQLAISFRTLTGDAAQAAEMLERVRAIGQATKFNTNEVARFAQLLASSGLQGEDLYTTLQRTLDLMAGLGVARADFERVAFNLMQIRAGGATAADLRQMLSAMPAIGRVLGEVTGAGRPLTLEEISALFQQQGGARFFDLLMQAGMRFEGASKQLTIFERFGNLMEQVGEAVLPTGQLLAGVLGGLATIATPLIGLFGRLNRALYGLPGAIAALTVAVIALTASLRVASTSSIGRTVSESIAAIATLLLLLRGKIGGAVAAIGQMGIRGAIAAALQGLWGLITRFKGIVGTILGILAVLAGDALGGALESRGYARAGQYLRDLLSFTATGAGIGALIGSVIPGLGTALGAIIGGGIGAIVASIKAIFFPARAQVTPEQRIADNTARMAQALEQIRVEIVGAGRRTGAFRTRFEAELAVQRILGLGVG